MFLPEPTTEENVFRAMDAALRLALLHSDIVRELYCPGMGTGVGRLAPVVAAAAMARASRSIAIPDVDTHVTPA